MKKKTKKKIIIVSVETALLLLIIFLIAPYTIGAILYNSVFGVRYQTTDYLKFYIEDFDWLNADRYEFTSNNNQKLVGYHYYSDDSDSKAVIVMAHGLGGGHNTYMDVAYYFTQNGYDVFAYDSTGNDESDGDGINGIPQGVADLDFAIDFVQSIDKLSDLPVMLWGHSWGGYCVSAVLSYHPEVKAIASIAGFNQSGDLIRAQGELMVGGFINFMMPYVNSIESLKCGDYSSVTALSGFASFECGVFIAHSSYDTTVPIGYGYDVYYEQYSDDSRFAFTKYDDRGHTNILYSDAYINYINEFTEVMNNYFSGSPTREERAAYYNEHLDSNIYCNRLNAELFEGIINFYNSYSEV